MAGAGPAAADTVRKAYDDEQALKSLVRSNLKIAVIVVFVIAASAVVNGQTVQRELALSSGQTIEIINRFGRVEVVAQGPAALDASDKAAVDELQKPAQNNPENELAPGMLSIISKDELSESEVIVQNSKGHFLIEVKPSSLSKRIDLKLSVPERTKLEVETRDGIILVDGDFESVKATTDTGTIAADVP